MEEELKEEAFTNISLAGWRVVEGPDIFVQAVMPEQMLVSL